MTLAEMRDSLRTIAEELEGARYDGTTAEQCRDLGEAARLTRYAKALVECAGRPAAAIARTRGGA